MDSYNKNRYFTAKLCARARGTAYNKDRDFTEGSGETLRVHFTKNVVNSVDFCCLEMAKLSHCLMERYPLKDHRSTGVGNSDTADLFFAHSDSETVFKHVY